MFQASRSTLLKVPSLPRPGFSYLRSFCKIVVLNAKQFNGQHGCTYCEDEGVARRTHLHRNWLYSASSVARTYRGIIANIREAMCNKARGLRASTMDRCHTRGHLGLFWVCPMGINRLPALHHYWSKDEQLHYKPIADRIPRDRFLAIWRFLHFTDNSALSSGTGDAALSSPPSDRLWKVRPVINSGLIGNRQLMRRWWPSNARL